MCATCLTVRYKTDAALRNKRINTGMDGGDIIKVKKKITIYVTAKAVVKTVK